MKKPSKKQQNKKIKEAIAMLNELVKTELAPSDIDGVGVFAMRDLKKGEKLYTDAISHAFDVPYSKFKHLRPEVSAQILGMWPNVVNGSHFFYPVTRVQAFLNHADKPNYDAKNDKTLKKIKKGEEITEDYRKIDGYKKIFEFLTE